LSAEVQLKDSAPRNIVFVWV